MYGAIAKGIGGAIVGEVAVNLALNTKGFNKSVSNTIKGTEKSFGSSFSKIGKVVASVFAIGKVVEFGKASVNAASQAQSAWTGLYSIVDGTGKSFADAKGFIEEYISDGLVPLSNATTAYKNLAARGYSTEQIEKTLIALKDAAAFGRQASYSLGDAITSATEGLKNENSILVDNAGVTKNVAKMWEDYAKSIGTTANELTQAQKIQAEYNGIMEETRFQTGDAATYTSTFAGRTAQLSTAFLNLKTAVGKVIAPIASALIPVLVNAMNVMTKFFNKAQQVLSVFGFKWQDVVTKNTASGISGIGDAASSTADSIGSVGDSAAATAKKLKRSLGGMDELNVLNFSDSAAKKAGAGASDVSSSVGSGLSGMFDNTIVEDPVSPQIKSIADKIKKYLEPLKKINLDNLSKSFDKLKDSLKPFKKHLFDGLNWLWFEFLVPIADWAIEDALPSFLDATSGGLNALNGAIEFGKPYLQFFWEEFLQPVASWTGGKIVDVLDWIGDKLDKVGDWLSDNAPTIEEVRKELKPWSDMLAEIGKFLGKILDLGWEAWKKKLSDVWNYALKPIWEYLLKPIFTSYWTKIKGLAEIIGGIFEALNKLMDGDWKGAGKSIFDGLVDGLEEIWNGSLVKKYLYDPIVGGFKKLFGINSPSTLFAEFGVNLVEGLWQGILSAKDWFVQKWETVKTWFAEIKPKITAKWSDTKTSVTNKWNEITSGLQEKKAKISAWYQDTKTSVKNKWNEITSSWQDKKATLKIQTETVTSNMKQWANNNIISKINRYVPFVNIPYLAQGGWFAKNNPTLAVVGDNKREPEVVTPESKIYDQALKAIKDSGGTGKQQLEITIYHKYEDGKTIIQKVNQAQIDAGEVLLLT